MISRGTWICYQFNLEYLAPVVWSNGVDGQGSAFADTSGSLKVFTPANRKNTKVHYQIASYNLNLSELEDASNYKSLCNKALLFWNDSFVRYNCINIFSIW